MCVEAVAHQFELAVGRDERYCSVVVKTSQPENAKNCLNVEDTILFHSFEQSPRTNIHLSKGSCHVTSSKMYLKKRPVSGAVFHTLSHGGICFVLTTVSFWNHPIEASHWLMVEFLSFLDVLKQNRPHHKQGHIKLCQKVVPVLWVPFCLKSQVRLERCAPSMARTSKGLFELTRRFFLRKSQPNRFEPVPIDH